MCENWAYHNEMFLFMRNFCEKIQSVMYKHTQVCNPCLPTFPEAALKNMHNLKRLHVCSPYFSRPYFLRYTPLVEVLQFTHCPLLDMDIFVQHVSQVKPQKLQVLDLTGVPSVTSLHMWSITYVCPNLCELYSSNRMSAFFGKQIVLNCQKLEVLDCHPLLGKLQEWRAFQDNTHVKMGPLMTNELQN